MIGLGRRGGKGDLIIDGLTRFRSRQADSFGAKVIAALRNEVGGHAVRPV
jgi:6-phosphogluconate dehydrogenase